VHRRPDVYEDPHAFRPERWLDRRPGTSTWFPFGGGVRRCIGAAFAEMEMRIALQAIASQVDIEPVDEGPEHVRRRAITLMPRHGGRVRIRGNRSHGRGVQREEWAVSSH
jgi:cytochrome P450